jgi:hypothetical protein
MATRRQGRGNEGYAMKIGTLFAGSLLTLSLVLPVGAAGVVDIGQSAVPDCGAAGDTSLDLDMSMAMAMADGPACPAVQPVALQQPADPLTPQTAAPVAAEVAAVAPEDDYVFPAPYPGFRTNPVQLMPQPAARPAPVRAKVTTAAAAQPVDLIPSPRLSATVTTAELRGPAPSARRELSLDSLWLIGAYR